MIRTRSSTWITSPTSLVNSRSMSPCPATSRSAVRTLRCSSAGSERPPSQFARPDELNRSGSQTQAVSSPVGSHGRRAVSMQLLQHDDGTRHHPVPVKFRQQLMRQPSDAGDLQFLADRHRTERSTPFTGQHPVPIRDRVTMRVELRVAQRIGDAVLELLTDVVLQFLRLVMHLEPAVTERFLQVRLDEPVMADRLQRDLTARSGQARTGVRLVVNESQAAQFAQHAGDAGGTDPECLRQLLGLHPLPAQVEQGLQVILAGAGQFTATARGSGWSAHGCQLTGVAQPTRLRSLPNSRRASLTFSSAATTRKTSPNSVPATASQPTCHHQPSGSGSHACSQMIRKAAAPAASHTRPAPSSSAASPNRSRRLTSSSRTMSCSEVAIAAAQATPARPRRGASST